jgi:2-keto-4-pentenoate hydratase/2-oxohepta-3-ene-1,7-dioic acid hydratase in catechol pathway
MKLARFTLPGDTEIRNGIVEGSLIREFMGVWHSPRKIPGKSYALDEVQLKAPLAPRNIIGIGKNFVGEEEEKPPVPKLPIFFLKPLNTVAGTCDLVRLPHGSERIKFEAELAVVIGKTAKSLDPRNVDEAIFGFTVANDIAAPDHFHPDGHWTIGKSFDSFTPLGPVIETEFDYRSAHIQASVNGVLKQNASMERIIMPIDLMISYISRFMTLNAGDVILTGTPAGADFVRDGDTVECFIEGIGQLRNPIAGK